MSDHGASVHSAVELFFLGKYEKSAHLLENIGFESFDTLEWVRDNNMNVCLLIWESIQGEKWSRKQVNKYSSALRPLLTKIRSLPPSIDLVVTESVVLYNYALLKTWAGLASNLLEVVWADLLEELNITLDRVLKLSKLRETLPVCRFTDPVLVTLEKCKYLFQMGKSGSGDPLKPVLCVWTVFLLSQGKMKEADGCLQTMKMKSRNSLKERSKWKVHFACEELSYEAMEDDSKAIATNDMIALMKSLCYISLGASHVDLEGLLVTPWVSYGSYARAFLSYKNGDMKVALAILQEALGRGIKRTRCEAAALNLQGCCLVKLGQISLAIQKYKEALEADFSFFIPLYNIALQYRLQMMVDAELEALNFLVTALEDQKMVSDDYSVHAKNGTVSVLAVSTFPCLSLSQALYLLAKRCYMKQKFADAAEKYLDLLTVLIDNLTYKDSYYDNLICLPNVVDIYQEAIFSLLSAGQWTECISVCDWVLSSLTCTQGAELLDADRLQADSPSERNDSFFSLNVNTPRKRHRSPADEPGMQGFSEVFANVMLHKSDALIHLNKTPLAINCLNEAIDIMSKECLRLKPECLDLSKFGEPEQKRKRIDDAGLSTSQATAGESQRENRMSTLMSLIYNNLGVVLQQERQYQKALHYFRLALQFCPDSPTLVYNCTLTLLRLQRCQEAASSWLEFRGISPKMDSLQLRHELHRRQMLLGSAASPDKNRSGNMSSPLSENALLYLDTKATECILESKKLRVISRH